MLKNGDAKEEELTKHYSGIKYYFVGAIRGLANWIHKSKEKSSSTSKLSRSHVIEISDSGLISLMGGKWTSFRIMGEETIELLLRHNKGIMPKHEKSQTQKFNLIGSYSKIEAIRGLQLPNEQLFNQYEDHLVLTRDLPRDVAKHLVHTYGTSSLRVVDVGDQNEKKRVSGTN